MLYSVSVSEWWVQYMVPTTVAVPEDVVSVLPCSTTCTSIDCQYLGTTTTMMKLRRVHFGPMLSGKNID
jgi:hypothetical protein